MTKQEAAHLRLPPILTPILFRTKCAATTTRSMFPGLARAVPNAVIKATGANLWTNNLRLGYQMSYFHQLANMAEKPWDKLDPNVRNNNFLAQYMEITPAGVGQDQKPSRSDIAPNGAKYVDLPKLTEADRELSERLQRAVGERSSYGAHQPDCSDPRLSFTRAQYQPGTIAGERQLQPLLQYKQFALERMSTHLMRTLYEWGRDRIG